MTEDKIEAIIKRCFGKVNKSGMGFLDSSMEECKRLIVSEYKKSLKNNDRSLLKEARDQLLMGTLIDRSGQFKEIV